MSVRIQLLSLAIVCFCTAINPAASNLSKTCLQVNDMVLDFLLERYLNDSKPLQIPNITTNVFLITGMEITGLNNVRRACPMAMRINSATSHMDVTLCLAASSIRTAPVVTATFHAFGDKIQITLYPEVEARDMFLEMSAATDIADNKKAVLKSLKIRNLTPVIRFKLMGSGFNRVFADALKNQLNVVILKALENEAKKYITGFFEKNPL